MKKILVLIALLGGYGCAYGGEANEETDSSDAGAEDCPDVPTNQTVMCAYNPVTNTGKCTTQGDAGLVECSWSCCY